MKRIVFQTKNKQTNITYWFSIGLIGQLIASPNAAVMKAILGSVDPTTFNTLRAAVCLVVALPFVLWYRKRINRKNLVFAIGAGLCTSVSVTLATYALQNSQATYVIVLSLLSPISLILLSSYFFHERVKLRAAAGVTLAALGGFIAVALPLAIGVRGGVVWYPLATGLMLLAGVFLPLATILLRKANETGLPLTSTQGISSSIVMITSLSATLAIHPDIYKSVASITPSVWIGIAYSAIIVIFIARIMTTASYERVGSAAVSAFTYLGMIVSLIIPILFLHERLSIATFIGGVVILLGVYLTEQHRSIHKHHRHLPIHSALSGH